MAKGSAAVRTDPLTALGIKAYARMHGLTEEEVAALAVAEYEERHADEMRESLERIARGKPTQRALRVLRGLCSPGGAAVLGRLYPPEA